MHVPSTTVPVFPSLNICWDFSHKTTLSPQQTRQNATIPTLKPLMYWMQVKKSPVKVSLPEKVHYHPHGNAPEDAGSLPRLKENACGIRSPTSSAATWVDTSPEAEAYRASSVGPEQLCALPYCACACAYVLRSEREPSAAHKGWVLPPSAGHWEECRMLRTPFTRIDSLEW